jgi:four helix bundle protein
VEAMTFPEKLRKRTKDFALQVIWLFRDLPRSAEAQIIGKQLLRSATSVAANYRAAGRARSKLEFTAKLGVTVEEADETTFWLEMLVEAEVVSKERISPILREANELLAIFAAAHKTSRRSRTRSPGPNSPDGPIAR